MFDVFSVLKCAMGIVLYLSCLLDLVRVSYRIWGGGNIAGGAHAVSQLPKGIKTTYSFLIKVSYVVVPLRISLLQALVE